MCLYKCAYYVLIQKRTCRRNPLTVTLLLPHVTTSCSCARFFNIKLGVYTRTLVSGSRQT